MIALYCPGVPPVPGGVSDHTLALARAIHALGGEVSVIAERGDANRFAPVTCVTGVEPGGVAASARALGADTVLIQYVPFLWGKRGVSPAFVQGVSRISQAGLGIATIVHEAFVPFTRLPWLVTGIPQRLQFRHLVRRASFVYTGLEGFARIARRYSGGRATVRVTPIGATIPVSPMSRADARKALGLADDRVAVGIFSPAASGYGHEWIAAAGRRLAAHPGVTWVRFGYGSERSWPGYPDARATLMVGEGPPEKIAMTMRALDIAAAPYVDGLTMRRSGAMLALASGVPTVSSTGHLFDPAMRQLAACEPTADEFAAELARVVVDEGARAELAARAANYGRLASIETLARQIIDDLETGDHKGRPYKTGGHRGRPYEP